MASKSFPSWLKQRIPGGHAIEATADCLRDFGLNTVCQSARCPNTGACFASGTATFMILGTVCTRRCTFCAVEGGSPAPLDGSEPERLAGAVKALELEHAVFTSVTRDDLADGGAGQFAQCVRAVRRSSPGTTVEILIPDFSGSREAVETVLASGPDVLNHNVETVPSIYESVRPGASYERSLTILRLASENGLITKSGLMLGLGETADEVKQVMSDLRAHGCDIITIGQYLPPSDEHFPLKRYVTPEEFARIEKEAVEMGFSSAACGPLVRSSYEASKLHREALSCRN